MLICLGTPHIVILRRPAIYIFFATLVLIVSLHGNLQGQGQQTTDQPSPALGARKEAPKGGTIRGNVIGTDTGAGLRKVTLMLKSTQAQTGDKPTTTQTDVSGEFRFEAIKPGKYTLSAFRNGYVNQVYGQKSINLNPFSQTGGITLDVRPGETLNSVNLKLIRGGAVEGRILDADNEPVARTFVQVSSYTSFQGKRRLMPTGMATTDDRGHYRIFNIPPGMYYLSAVYHAFEIPEGDSGSPPTYYPGVMTLQEASKIQVSAARDLTGLDMILAEGESYSVSGKIVGSDGKPILSAWINPVRVPLSDFFFFALMSSTDAQGEFKLKGLLPGKYRLSAGTQREGKQLAGNAIVEVSNSDIEGVLIALGEGIEITGRVVIEGQNASLELRRLRVSLMADLDSGGGDFMGGTAGSEVKEDLTFRLANVSEMAGYFRVSGLTGNLFLKSVHVDGQEMTDTPIEIKGSSPIEGVEIIISSQGASLNGLVKAEEQGPPVKGATVMAFPADPESRGVHSRFVKTAQTDQQGIYTLQGLPPGEYFLSALKSVEGGLESDEAFLKQLQKISTKVLLETGETKTESLIAVDAPEIE